MTLNDLIECILEGETPTDMLACQCFLAVAGVLRTVAQGEPATFEGECTAVMALVDRGLYTPDLAGLDKFRRECPNLLAIDVPEQIIMAWASADKEDE